MFHVLDLPVSSCWLGDFFLMQIWSATLLLHWFPVTLKIKSTKTWWSLQNPQWPGKPSPPPADPLPPLAPLSSYLFFSKTSGLLSFLQILLSPSTQDTGHHFCLGSSFTPTLPAWIVVILQDSSLDKSFLTHKTGIYLPLYMFSEVSKVSLHGT